MRIAVSFEFSFVHDARGGGHILFEDMLAILNDASFCETFCFVADEETKISLEKKYVSLIFVSYNICKSDNLFYRFYKIRKTHLKYKQNNFDKVISHTREIVALLSIPTYRARLVIFVAYPRAIRFASLRKNNIDILCYYIAICLHKVDKIYLSEFIKTSTAVVLGSVSEGRVLRPYFDKGIVACLKRINETRKSSKPDCGKLKVISVGRLDFNHKPLLPVLKELAALNADIDLTVVGNGPDYSRLKKFVKLHFISQQITVRLEKNLNRNQVIEEFGNSDIALLPSNYESFMLTAYEAFLSGCTLVVNDVANLKSDFRKDPSVFFLDDGPAGVVLEKALAFASSGRRVRNVDFELRRLDLAEENYINNLKGAIGYGD